MGQVGAEAGAVLGGEGIFPLKAEATELDDP